jgi:hypothetical protein
METSKNCEPLIIGKHIEWAAIEGQYCRVKHFTPFAVVEPDKVKAFSPNFPYASLLVECPEAFKEASMPVLHKLDFRNLWEVFMERKVYGDTRDYGVSTKMEVLVVYAPLKRRKLTKLFSGILPSLVIQLYPKGFLERLEEKPDTGLLGEEYLKSLLPIAEWDARPEELK